MASNDPWTVGSELGMQVLRKCAGYITGLQIEAKQLNAEVRSS
jgi:hypothetical protein